MEKQTLNIKERLFSLDQIKDEILNIKLTTEQKELLSYGEEVYLSKMELNNGTVRDGKVKLTKDAASGELAFAFNFKKEELKIDDEYLNKKLSKEEKEDLQKGKTVGPFSVKGNDHFIEIDNSLNKVTVKSAQECGIKRTVGGYTFSDQEMNSLANGEKLATKVYKGENGYFIANLQRTDDKKGITFSNIMAIDQLQAEELIKKYNKAVEPTIIKTADIANMAMDGLNLDSKEKELKNKPEFNIEYINNQKVDISISPLSIEDKENQQRLSEAIHNKEYAKINELVSKGITPTNDDVLMVKHSNAFSAEDKIALLTTLGQGLEIKTLEKVSVSSMSEKITTSMDKTKDKGMGM